MADGMPDQIAKSTEEISVRDVFGLDTDMKVKGFAERGDCVPEIDSTSRNSSTPTPLWPFWQALPTTAA